MAKNNFGKIINFIAFVGLVTIAISLILQTFLKGELLNAIKVIGEVIAYTITAVSAFFYVKSKRNVWWYVAYAVAIALVVVFMVIR